MGASREGGSHEGRKLSMYSETPSEARPIGSCRTSECHGTARGLEGKIQRKFSNSTSQPIGSLQATAQTRGLGKGAQRSSQQALAWPRKRDQGTKKRYTNIHLRRGLWQGAKRSGQQDLACLLQRLGPEVEDLVKIPGRGSGLVAMRMCSEASLTWRQKWACLS